MILLEALRHHPYLLLIKVIARHVYMHHLCIILETLFPSAGALHPITFGRRAIETFSSSMLGTASIPKVVKREIQNL